MSDRFLKRLITLSVLALAPVSAFADWELNMPRGVTDMSNEIYELHMLIFWICVAIAVLVFGAMIYSIINHTKARNPEPAKFHHNTRLEIVWTTIPFVILIGMAIPSAKTLIALEDTRGAELTVQVTGSQWKWNYNYIDEGFSFFSSLDEASNEARQLGSGIDPASVDNYLLDVDRPMVVPVGAKVRVLLTASDVIHAWWVPDFGGEGLVALGFVNEYWFQAEQEGTYRGVCAELCGRDHGFMPVVVEVVSAEAYASWIDEQQSQVVAIDYDRDYTMDELMAAGETAYGTMCAACHQANGEGLEAAGFPSLVGTPMTTEDMAGHIDVILNGRPGTAMAAFAGQLDDLELAGVVTYERNAWGNDTGDVVQPRDIRDAR